MGDSAQKTLKYSHEPSHPKTCTCNPWCLSESYHENLTCTLWVSNRTKHWYLVTKLLYSSIYLFFANIWSRWDIKEDILTFSLHAEPSGPSSSKKYFLVCIPWRSRRSSGWPRSWTTCRICRQKHHSVKIWKVSWWLWTLRYLPYLFISTSGSEKVVTEVKESEDAAGSPHVDAMTERQAKEYLWSPVRCRLQDHPWSESGLH